MSEIDPFGHVSYKLRNASVKKWPFPHFFADDVFPDDFYTRLREDIAAKTDYVAKGNYHGRMFKTPDLPQLNFMQSQEFLREVAQTFAPQLHQHFSGREMDIYADLRLVRDGAGYYIGPHTDAPWKLVSLLFYLPPDDFYYEHGTSIYLPKDRAFRCAGGPHRKFEDFDRIYTAPYLRNTCFGFFKTDNSFHGVEPIHTEFKRDVLLFNLYDKEIYLRMNNKTDDAK